MGPTKAHRPGGEAGRSDDGARRAKAPAKKPPKPQGGQKGAPTRRPGGSGGGKATAAKATKSARGKAASSGAQGRSPLAGLSELDGGGSPASRRALRNQGRRTMRKLLDAAMEAFDRRGFHATRVNDVVEIAQTSHGTFYLYFSNKEDLLRALVLEAANEVQELDLALPTGPRGTSWEDLRAWIGAYSSMWRRYAPLLRAWTDLANTDPELATLVADTMGAMTDAISEWIRANGPPEGIDPQVGGVAVMSMLDRFHYLQEFLGQTVDDTSLDTLTTMVLRAATQARP